MEIFLDIVKLSIITCAVAVLLIGSYMVHPSLMALVLILIMTGKL